MTQVIIKPSVIGKIAAQQLASSSEFSIRGITSKGIFTYLNNESIVFLSRETFKGPLVVNLSWTDPALEKINLESSGKINNSGYLFNNLDLQIDCGHVKIWSAAALWPPTSPNLKLPTEETLINFCQTLQAKSENELISNVIRLMNPSLPSPAPLDPLIADKIQQFTTGFREMDINSIDQVAHYFAGRGRGLTPSGDDFLLGIVYGLFLMQHKLKLKQLQITEPIVNTVKRRSTLISANLVACASLGEVDERLGTAFQKLLNAPDELDGAVNGLLNWGSSSGMDTAAGMVLLLHAMR